MQVILLERVAKLGQMGEVVSVKDGYARNYLLPQGKALWASEANVKKFEEQKSQFEARNLESRKEAENLAGVVVTTRVLPEQQRVARPIRHLGHPRLRAVVEHTCPRIPLVADLPVAARHR